MIFVSVGTHPQPFDRLLVAVDRLAAASPERCVVQSGASSLRLAHCEQHAWLTPDEVRIAIRTARVVVLHGGSSSFLLARGLGRIPIVVPRDPAHGEHVDDHQLVFAAHLARRAEAVVCGPDRLSAAVARHVEPEPRPDDRTGEFVMRFSAAVDALLGRDGPTS